MLVFRSVTVQVETAQVLRNVSFEVAAAATLALVGRNGAGKTTTLRAAMGLVPVSGGEVTFAGMKLDTLPPHRRSALGIGYAPEDRRLFSAFSVEENILLPARAGRFDKQRIRRTLEDVYETVPELRDLRHRPAGSVSGGQGKMVALGRALMAGTKLVLLDEPFQGLAPALVQRYASALRRLRQRAPQLAILITESNPELLAEFADATCRIERGAIESTSG